MVWTVNPQSEAKIIWETDFPTENDFVRLWTSESDPIQVQSLGSSAYTANEAVSKNDKGKKVGVEPWYYRYISLNGLKPSTTYYFTAHSDGRSGLLYLLGENGKVKWVALVSIGLGIGNGPGSSYLWRLRGLARSHFKVASFFDTLCSLDVY